ncbi:MAG: hypothetical protein J5873_04185, partial [Bacteroidales bacterium]|nr:hypothetical protein [Bacteroidales bacterium]
PKAEDDLTPATKENISIDELKKTWMSKSTVPTVFVSATRQDNIDELKELILKEVRRLYAEIYPYKYIADPYAYPLPDTEENSQ